MCVNLWRRVVPLPTGEVGVHYQIGKAGVLRGEVQTVIQEVGLVHHDDTTGWLQRRIPVGQESGKRESHSLGVHNQVLPVEILCDC